MPFDGGHKMPRAYSGQQNHGIDLRRHQAVGEIDSSVVIFERHFSHRRGDMSDTTVTFNQPHHVVQAATFKGGNVKSGE
jgi:hypothetical protein